MIAKASSTEATGSKHDRESRAGGGTGGGSGHSLLRLQAVLRHKWVLATGMMGGLLVCMSGQLSCCVFGHVRLCSSQQVASTLEG